ncbi:MAG: hypothetical protein EPO35_09185 [Acidobacteria bacterium]|nr:MAG: hypothetical protein EPO35_09185 [Acidobacteriota bacterium]
MTKAIRSAVIGAFVVGATSVALAQEPSLQQQPPPQQGRQGGRQGQPAGQPQQPGPQGEGFSPAYIQQMFDTMAIVEAERFLPLSAEQYPGFVQKLKRLQETKMQANRRRTKVMNELRGLVGPQAMPDVPDALIDAKLKELAAAETEGPASIRKAQDELDAALSVRQRARLRMLEENVEKRKIDFLTRVRQGGGGFEGIPR